MKKRVSKWAVMLGILMGVFLVNGTAHAAEDFIINSEVPENSAVVFATSDFNYSLNATLFLEKSTKQPQEYQLGSPFTIINNDNKENETVSFPVIYQGKIEYVYSVIKNPNGEYTSSCSRFLADELQTLQDSGITETTLFTKESNIYYEKDDQLVMLYEAPNHLESVEISQEDTEAVNDNTLTPVLIEQETEVEKEKTLGTPKESRSGVSYGTNYAMINWTIKENQTDQQWCAAFVTAGILNNKNSPKPSNAKSIMKYFNPSLNDTSLKQVGLSREQAVKYGKSKGCNPYIVNGMVDKNEIHNQVRRGNAIYAGGFGIQGQSKTRHAFALYGWVQQGDVRTLYLWNPWYNHPMVVNGNTAPIIFPTPSGGYVWDVSITNW